MPSRRPFAVCLCPCAMILVTAVPGWCQPSPVTVRVETAATMADGTAVERYTMSNENGMQVSVITHGATITGVLVPDRAGKVANVTLHFDDVARYCQGHPLFGSIVGRFANRIAHARFTIDGTAYDVTRNAGSHHIHGGQMGFHKIVWSARAISQADRACVELKHTSPDGHEGYPGRLEVTLHYLLTADNRLILEYWAKSDRATHVNLTNHAYWNLGGVTAGNVLDHVMTIQADEYLEATPQRFPTGVLRSVDGTPLDFRTPHTIGSRIDQLDSKNYDDCYVIRRSQAGELVPVARAEDLRSGRVMQVWSTAPGVQFYTARALDGSLGGEGVAYGPYHGFCLETQHFPDSPNQPHFPSTLLRPDETYHQVTIYQFSVEQ